MNDIPRWVLPGKVKGKSLTKRGDKWDPVYSQAALEIAAEEAKRSGETISFYTLHRNLSTQRGQAWTEIRSRLNKRVRELEEQEKRHANTNKTEQQAYS